MSQRVVYVWGPISAVHVALERDGELLTDESCNLDDIAGERSSGPVPPPGSRPCKTCLPDGFRAELVEPAAEEDAS